MVTGLFKGSENNEDSTKSVVGRSSTYEEFISRPVVKDRLIKWKNEFDLTKRGLLELLLYVRKAYPKLSDAKLLSKTHKLVASLKNRDHFSTLLRTLKAKTEQLRKTIISKILKRK